MPLKVTTSTPLEPTTADLDGIIEQLKASWTARVTVRRQAKDDVGLREIYVNLDDERVAVLRPGQEVTRDVQPGPHRLRVHNTLFWKTCEFTVAVGEHASFMAANRAGFATFSILALFLGANLLYLSLERDTRPAP
ncbi:MAG: hypothetical protein AB7Q29_12820 [Vicinamibacterales bacterium]